MTKTRKIFAVVNLFIGIFLIIGPQTLFKVCDTSEMVMKCHWSVRAILGIGLLYIVSSVLIIFFKKSGEQRLLGIIIIVLGLICISIPLILIGGCSNSAMSCQSLTFPAIYLLSAISVIVAVIHVIYTLKVAGVNEK